MPKYRKKPVVIEAIQFLPGQNDDNVLYFLDACTGWRVEGKGIVIPTLARDHLALPNDWIIRGSKGEFYPCKPDIFVATYDPVDD